VEPAHPLVKAPGRSPAVARRVAGAFVLLGVLLLYRAPARFVWNAWLSDPYYAHGLPVFAAAVALAAWRLWKAPRAEASVPAWALLGLPLAGALYLAGLLRADAYLLSWSALALAASVALASGGWPRLRLVGAPLLLAALALPTPWTIQVCVALQDGATAATGFLLSLAGIALERGLTTLTAGGLSFEVTPACSGFQSAVSLLAVGAGIATIFPRRAGLVLALAVPVALALNVLRLVLVVLIGLAWGPGAAEGFFHGLSDALIFVAETLLLLAVAGALSRPRGRAA